MFIGVPKEIKDFESRVGMTLVNVHELTTCDHGVGAETKAGFDIGCDDDAY